MEDNGKTPQKNYSVEEILAEARMMKENGKSKASPPAASPESSASTAPVTRQAKNRNGGHERPQDREEIFREARCALNMETGGGENGGREEPAQPEKKPKKHRFPLFHRRKKEEEFHEEDDLYYGLQLRPLEDYRKEYEKTISSGSEPGDSAENQPGDETGNSPADGGKADLNSTSSFPYLFDKEKKEDPGMAETFDRIHRERHERLEKIMQQAGLDPDEILPQEEPVVSPQPPAPGPAAPPVPGPVPERPHDPAVTPGPQRQPEVRPPVTQPVPELPPKPEVTTKAAVPPPERKETAEEAVPEAKGEKSEPSSPKEGSETAEAEQTPPPPVKEPKPAPPPAREEQRTPPPRTEPEENPRPGYRACDAPIHVIRPIGLKELLETEAAQYPPPKPLEPIPLPPKEAANPAQEERPEEEPVSEAEEPEKSPAPETRESAPPELPEEPSAEEEALKPQRSGKKKFRLFGEEEPEEAAPEENPAPKQEEIDDYTNPSDAPSIRHDLLRNVTRLSLRLAITGISALILLAVGILSEHPAILPPEVHMFFDGPSGLVIQLIFLLIAAAFNYPTFWNGLKGLTSFQANVDSAVAVAVLAALVQNAVLLFTGVPQGSHLYSPLAAAALFLNTAGKFSMARRMFENFRVLCAKGQKSAVRIYGDYNTALRLAKDCVAGEPCIAYQSEAAFPANFLRNSYEQDPADHISHVMAPVGFLLCLALCAASAFLTSGGAVQALTALTVACCVCVPFANLLCVNLPVSRLSAIARRSGSMVAGWSAIDRFSKTNAVMLEAQDLFPRGTVILNGIRTFAGQRIDEAILDAAALMCTVGGPLSDLFDQIIKSRREILPKISPPAYEDGKGVTGVVSGRQILVGTSELMRAHGIEPPSRDYEKKYIQNGKKLVYLASDGCLVAMFIINYCSDLHRSRLPPLSCRDRKSHV